MTPESSASRLRALRRRSGLSQKDLAEILGFANEKQISRHELSDTVPNLLTAFAYEVIFRTPPAEIFSGFYRSVEAGIEERIGKMETDLGKSSANDRKASLIARKLEFFCERNQAAQ
jgi:transcriptional regulator with XRE-family HTH domain